MTLSMLTGVLAALVQFLGLIRWPFLVPFLAREAEQAEPGSARGEAIDVVFQSLHRYLGGHVRGAYVLRPRRDTGPPAPALGALHRDLLRERPSLTTISVAPGHIEATDGQLTAIVGTGNQRHVIVPGVGPILAQAGRFVIDPVTGNLTAVYGLNIPAGSAFCAALSG